MLDLSAVGLMGCRTNGISDQWAFRNSGMSVLSQLLLNSNNIEVMLLEKCYIAGNQLDESRQL